MGTVKTNRTLVVTVLVVLKMAKRHIPRPKQPAATTVSMKQRGKPMSRRTSLRWAVEARRKPSPGTDHRRCCQGCRQKGPTAAVSELRLCWDCADREHSRPVQRTLPFADT